MATPTQQEGAPLPAEPAVEETAEAAPAEEGVEGSNETVDMPMIGQSLTTDPDNPAPYERPPEFANIHDAIEYLWEHIIVPETYQQLMESIADQVPIMDITQLILFVGFRDGKWNPDLMLLLGEPLAYMLIALAERLDLPMSIYEGDMDDEDETEEILGAQMQESKLRDMQDVAAGGKAPAHALTPAMQEDLDTLPEYTPKKNQGAEQPEVGTPPSLLASPPEQQT